MWLCWICWKLQLILLLGLIVAMEMVGWAHCIMGYITLVWSGCILHILANLEVLLGVMCNQKIGIFYTASLRHTVEIVAWYNILNDCWVSESSECGFEDQSHWNESWSFHSVVMGKTALGISQTVSCTSDTPSSRILKAGGLHKQEFKVLLCWSSSHSGSD